MNEGYCVLRYGSSGKEIASFMSTSGGVKSAKLRDVPKAVSAGQANTGQAPGTMISEHSGAYEFSPLVTVLSDRESEGIYIDQIYAKAKARELGIDLGSEKQSGKSMKDRREDLTIEWFSDAAFTNSIQTKTYKGAFPSVGEIKGDISSDNPRTLEISWTYLDLVEIIKPVNEIV
jgi:hypothetical protein